MTADQIVTTHTEFLDGLDLSLDDQAKVIENTRRAVTEALATSQARTISHMVNRFLGWRLPENFNPDAGISFTPCFNEHLTHPTRHQPTGTNLFDATQAEAMVRYMVEGDNSAATQSDKYTAEDALRELASYVSAGGYNAEAVDPAVFFDKIKWGVDHLIEVTIQRCADVIEEQSKNYGRATWGSAKRAILDLRADAPDASPSPEGPSA